MSVGTGGSSSELIGESELVFLAWRQVPFPDFFGRFDSVPFPDFLGRFASWQATLLAGVLALAKVSNR